jgi:AcrR family transcriptional regulator
MSRETAGRPRDTDIDERVLSAARRHLASHGYEAMSVAAVAQEAGTTRQALYRRWPTKADLATAAIAAMSRADERAPTDDPFSDLVAELEAFRRGISRPDGISLVGTMLLHGTEPDLVRFYRERLVVPRRARLRTILERARDGGLLDADADLDTAVNAFTGTWYARELAGGRPPAHWPEQVAALVWRGLGGTPPR